MPILGWFSEIIILLPRVPRDIAAEIILFTQETMQPARRVGTSQRFGWVGSVESQIVTHFIAYYTTRSRVVVSLLLLLSPRHGRLLYTAFSAYRVLH